MRMLLECDVGQSRVSLPHVLASLLRRYNQEPILLQFRISSAMVGMVMRIDHVLMGWFGKLLSLPHDVSAVDSNLSSPERHLHW